MQHFRKCGRLDYVNIAMKKDPNNSGGKLSMGYGFVRYKLKADAEKALKELQMTVVDGKTLELKRSERALQYVSSLSSLSPTLKENLRYNNNVQNSTDLMSRQQEK